MFFFFFFFSSRRRHTRLTCDWSSDVCSSDLGPDRQAVPRDDDLPQSRQLCIRRPPGSRRSARDRRGRCEGSRDSTTGPEGRAGSALPNDRRIVTSEIYRADRSAETVSPSPPREPSLRDRSCSYLDRLAQTRGPSMIRAVQRTFWFRAFLYS